jgi:hypothetical protein
MRASPAFQVTVRCFGIWHGAVVALLGLTALACGGWLFASDPPASWLVRAGVLVTVGGLGAAAAKLLRLAPRSLRWDSQAWHLGAASAVGEEPSRGQLAVAIDLGAWMLLKFEPALMQANRRVTWLPVQRRGLEAQWHALRCAVYFARSAAGHDGNPGAATRPEAQE